MPPGPELDHILKLQVTWSVDDIVAAIEHATKYDAFDARAIERILEARFRPRRLAEQIADATRTQIRDAMREHPVEQRALSSYETLRLGDGFLREPREEDVRDETGGSGKDVQARFRARQEHSTSAGFRRPQGCSEVA